MTGKKFPQRCLSFISDISDSFRETYIFNLIILVKMESIDDAALIKHFENNMIHKPYETRKQYFDDKIGKFVNNYIFQSNQSHPPVVWKKIL